MATYAIVSEDNVVLNVVKIADEDIEDENGNEIPEKVLEKKNEICGEDFSGRLIKTSYNNNGNGLYAGIGHTYSDDLNVFVREKSFDYCTFNVETGLWDFPIEEPQRTQYQIENNIVYRWEDSKYQNDETPWVTDYTGEYPELTDSELERQCAYTWDPDTYVEGDVSSGFKQICLFTEDDLEPLPSVDPHLFSIEYALERQREFESLGLSDENPGPPDSV